MRPGHLYNYIHRCGSVEVQRAKLPLLAHDLQLRAEDLNHLIQRMTAVGQVVACGEVLRFATPAERLMGGTR